MREISISWLEIFSGLEFFLYNNFEFFPVSKISLEVVKPKFFSEIF